MSVAPHAGVIDFGTFISPSGGQDGVQGEVPAPLAVEAGYVLTTAGWGPVEALPPQAGNAGEFLTTNGVTASWAPVDALPSQSGQAGKYLTTDGTTASWATVNAGVTSVNGQTGVVTLTAADVGAVQQSLVNILLTGF